MDNYLVILRSSKLKIDFDVKFFLVKLLQNFNLENKINLSVKDLSHKFGVTNRVVTKSFEVLVSKKVIKKSDEYGGKGRPCNKYLFTEDFKRDVKKESDNFECHNKSFIDELLVPDVNKGVQPNSLILKKHPIGLSTRMLLIVMLSVANKEGFLFSLGVADLGKLGGISSSAVRINIKKLKASGYIRRAIGGITSPKFIGNGKSYYYLNLFNNKFDTNVSEVIFMFESDEVMEAMQIYNYVRNAGSGNYKSRIRLFENNDITNKWSGLNLKKVKGCFTDDLTKSFLQYFQVRLYYYASLILMNNKTDLSEHFGKESILSEINKTLNGNFIYSKSMLCEFIYDISHYIAVGLYKKLRYCTKLSGVNLEGYQFIITPDKIIECYKPKCIISFYSQTPFEKLAPVYYIGNYADISEDD